MRCTGCQCENREGPRFCAECGAPLALACPSCGFANEAGEKFCGGCGMHLAEQIPAPQSQPLAPRAQAPRSYTPRHLAERILAEQAALEARGDPDGERKTITALFADIKGSMDLLQDLDPEEARRLIDPALQLMMQAVHRYEGYVAPGLFSSQFDAHVGAASAATDGMDRD